MKTEIEAKIINGVHNGRKGSVMTIIATEGEEMVFVRFDEETVECFDAADVEIVEH